jgi:rRNA maturation endonuclease Nob1
MVANSFLENLLSELDRLETLIYELLDASKIGHSRDDPGSGIVWIGSSLYWDKLDNEGLIKQAKALKAFTSIYEIIEFIFSDKPSDTKSKIGEIKTSVMSFVDQKAGLLLWEVPSSISEAKKTIQSSLVDLRSLLDSFKSTGEQGFIMIPDANALIRNPDIHTYGDDIGSNRYTIIFIPTVLSELDSLKIIRREEEFRKKVESVINRIKGFRQQGSLLDGVITYKTVTVKTIATEPNVKEVLSWLDENVSDDKIIATSLEIQRQNLGAKVVLVTSDINLQNKAEAARLPYIETPEQKQSTQ